MVQAVHLVLLIELHLMVHLSSALYGLLQMIYSVPVMKTIFIRACNEWNGLKVNHLNGRTARNPRFSKLFLFTF